MWSIGFWKTVPGFSGRYCESSPSVKVSSEKTASGLGVMVLSNRVKIASGMLGVGVMVGVSETNGVNVMVGLSVMVGESVNEGVSVMVSVGVKVEVGV